MDVRLIEHDRDALGRVETGPVQFGDDWPGIFIRGDIAFGLAIAIEQALADEQPEWGWIYKRQARGMVELLRSCVVRPAQGIEAGTATTGTGVVHESPVGQQADAPTPSPGDPHNG